MFSIDQLLATPPLSAIFSILLIAGCDLIGVLMLRSLLFEYKGWGGWMRWQTVILGSMLLAIILYPLALANLTSRFFMQVVAILCIILGIFQLYLSVNYIKNLELKLNNCVGIFRAKSLPKKLLLIILLGMGLIALGPETSADGLNYHLGIAIAILNNGGMPVVPEWFMGRLAGNGEVLNAIGLSIGAEQFGSLLQFSSLLGVVGLILFARNINGKLDTYPNNPASDLIALAAVSAPALLFLVSSSKPQIWPISMTTLAFALVVHPSRHHLSRSNALIGYTLTCLLVMTASQAKFNFLLGGGVVGVLALIAIVRRGYFWESLCILLVTGILIIAPPVIWKSVEFKASLLDALINPWPGGLPGTNIMDFAIRYRMDIDSKFPFPLSMFIPTSLGTFSAMLGVGGLVLLALRPYKNVWLWYGIFAASFVVMVNILLAPKIGRMYFEPYFWLLFILALKSNEDMLNYCKWIRWPIFSQAFLVIGAAWFGALLLFPGALLPLWRSQVMVHSANGYEIMQWADSVLPENAVVLLNGSSSMALSPRDSVSSEWMGYVDSYKPESSLYLDRLKFKKVSHILIIGTLNYKQSLSGCFGKVLAGPGIGHWATRNPFNKGSTYEAWVLEFDAARLPECAFQKQPSAS
jgi:hypothetical protein